jgi:MtrB/PioB family decaheme-associated outer membrane protein
MNTDSSGTCVRKLCAAVRRACLASLCVAPLIGAAQEAPNDEVAALVYPTSFFDLGALAPDESSTKFGEYNGLNESGPYVLADFDVRAGSAYGMGDGTTRFRASGTNLGTNSRGLAASIAAQGQWDLAAGYDRLRHYTTDNYQTPLLGSQGSNVFSLLPSFGVINTTVTTTNGVITSASKGAQTLTATQLSQFHDQDVYTQRDNTSLSAGYRFGREWSLRFDYKRLDQSGAKLIAAGTDALNLTGAGGFNFGGERVLYLMNPTEYDNDTFNFALNWTGQQAYASLSWYASLFHDDYAGVSFPNPFVSGGTGAAPKPATGTSPGAFPVNTMSTPPDNSLHQFNFTGGWILTPALKLVGGFSYAHNRQNAGFDGTYTTTPDTVPLLPVASLDGRVDLTHADVKLTWQPGGAWNVDAGFKYNERSNRTASYEYTFVDLGGEERSAVNIPMSNKRTQFDLGAHWRIDARQGLRLAYEHDRIRRWCRNALANQAQGELSAANAGYYTTASCVQVPRNDENRVLATYRVKASDRVDFDAGYTYGRRTAEVNPSFYNPMQSDSNGFENFGYRAFFDASRRQNLFKAGVTWQATPKFSLGLNGRHAKDDYFDSPLGVQEGRSSSANVDVNYAFSEDASIGGYFSWQKRTRELLTASGRNALAPPTALWSNDLRDRDNSFGASARQKNLFGGRFELREDLAFSLAKTKYVTTLVQNIAPSLSNQGEVPNISSELGQFRVTGAWQFDRHSSLLAGFQYQRLKASDYLYYAFAYGFAPTGLLPSNQQAPNYRVNTVFAAYRYRFH